MKKLLFICACTIASSLSAVVPGDRPGSASARLEWLDCSPMPFGRIDPEVHKNIPPLRALVFMYTRAADSDRTISMLESLRRQNYEKVLISAITPDSPDDAQEFRKRHKDVRVRMAVDLERRLTPEYMHGSIMLFPMAFLMDADGVIIWRGEAVDLPEAVELQLAGKLDLALQKKTAPMVYQMQQHMRSGNMFKLYSSAQEILKIDPANAAALRMAVFAAENLNDLKGAWQLTMAVLQKRPDLPRIYFTALDLTMRHSECRPHLAALIAKFNRNPFTISVRCAFIDSLLNNFPFETAAVLGAKDILAATPMPLNAAAEQQGMILTVRSKLHYLLGSITSAEIDIAEAVNCFRAAGAKSSLIQAEKQLQYYRSLQQFLKQVK
ncbi:MAG: hypothetical protein E7058_05795 [Lentisphaerae bacterium]|nr:hypothetical protein [Lentisphaerota bacterium]